MSTGVCEHFHMLPLPLLLHQIFNLIFFLCVCQIRRKFERIYLPFFRRSCRCRCRCRRSSSCCCWSPANIFFFCPINQIFRWSFQWTLNLDYWWWLLLLIWNNNNKIFQYWKKKQKCFSIWMDRNDMNIFHLTMMINSIQWYRFCFFFTPQIMKISKFFQMILKKKDLLYI